MSSIKDVARLAGVSVTTVSHVLNKTRSVLPATQERVLEAVQTLGYVPSAVARSLKTQATHTIGMLVPDNSNPYFAELVRAVEDACFAAGYALLLCNTDNDAGRQQVYLDVLSQKRVDGLIVASTSDDALMSQHLVQTALPMVLIDRAIAGLERPCVQTDHVQGGMLATQHLMALGRKRIACVAGPQDLQSSEQRVQGWRQALQLVGLPSDLLMHGDFTVNGGYVAMQRLLHDGGANRPTAVFACNDLMAMGALRAVHEAGLQVPRDVAVVGYDDIELASYTQPALTTVAQPTRAMAQQALAWLLERIQAGRSSGPAAAATQMLVPALVTRESSRALARAAVPIVSGETV
ncbi:LacI family DNA-binding transcriptional regulator [Comamonas sp.]|uniref:LacI family DNA-binding transcriptional regulator n=1 Tax=Comamonas sp. TaxID=34028 RepID=UPI00289C382D|nr:LacI family DNA-binding transcriptional regulator [Comamonas sp.]